MRTETDIAGRAPKNGVRRLALAAALAALYALGTAHWSVFFNGGRMSFAAEDWPKEYMYYSILRDALRHHRLPYHSSALFQNTDRFLALPETNLSPQIALLPYMATGRFVLFNVLLLYSLGFAGCLLLMKKFQLSLLPFAALFLLFNFNGHITAHLAVGHSMWGGYFLLPFFFLALVRLAERPASPRGPLLAALAMAAILLQGAFHFFVWCLLFTVLFAACNRAYRRPALLAVLAACLLSSFRLVPAAVAFIHRREPFVSGYPTLAHLVASLTVVRDYAYRGVGGIFGAPRWWEFDLYVGLAGFLFLLYFGVYRGFGRKAARPDAFTPFALPALLLAVLSLNYFYAFVAGLPLPLAAGERVSARFIIIPFFVLLVVACARLEQMRPFRGAAGFLSVAAVLETMFSLATHSWVWRIARIEGDAPGELTAAAATIVQRPDRWYELSVNASALVSAAVFLAVTFLAVRAPEKDGSISGVDGEVACR